MQQDSHSHRIGKLSIRGQDPHWLEGNGVRTLQDVAALDKRRQEKQAKKSTAAPKQNRNTSSNRFNNFEQRSYNYDDYVWADIKSRK